MGARATGATGIAAVLAEVARRREEEKKRQLSKRIPGSFTAQEYAAQAGISGSHARKHLRELVEAGAVKMCKIPMLRNGVVFPSIGYVLITKKSSSPSRSPSRKRK